MTKNLKLFTLFCIVWSVPFFITLNWALDSLHTRKGVIFVVCAVYTIGFSLAAHYLSRRDPVRDVRYGLGSRYSVVSAVAATTVGCIWILGWRREFMAAIAIYIALAVGVCVQSVVWNRRAIKGVSKEKLFK